MNLRLTYFILLIGCAAGVRAQDVFPNDTLLVNVANCEMASAVCLPVPLEEAVNYDFALNGQPYQEMMPGCAFDTIIQYNFNTLFGAGTMGPYQLTGWNVSGMEFTGQFDNLFGLVALMNMWNTAGNWTYDPTANQISGGAPSDTYGSMNITAVQNGQPSIIGVNFGLNAQGIAVNLTEGTHLIEATDADGATDSLVVVVTCFADPTTDLITNTIVYDGSSNYKVCLGDEELTGPPVSITNICPEASGTFVDFYLDPTTFCVKYQATACGGTETACVVLCDANGVCDTTFFEITVTQDICDPPSETIRDTLLINFTETFCLDTTQLPGTVLAVENICPDQSGDFVDFDVDETTWCVTYTGFAPLGSDRACLVLTDDLGFTDTTFLNVYVDVPQSTIVTDTIAPDAVQQYCLDADELAGAVVSIENSCPELSGTAVEFAPDLVSLCVTVSPLTIGTDTACIVLCDEFGTCDTTFLHITVINSDGEPVPPPVAVDDRDTVVLNGMVVVNVLGNDTLPPGSTDVTVTLLDPNAGGGGPNNGTASVNNDGTLTYTPDAGFCGGEDVFTYVLCNQTGCDTADVVITVLCEDPMEPDEPGPITVFTGFSPNGDGNNDTFTIDNVEDYPDAKLTILNRWGNAVLQAENGYRNTWDGTWEGRDLPDGTYFYFLEIDDERWSGYLQLRR